MADTAASKAAPKTAEGGVEAPSGQSLPPGDRRRRVEKKRRTGPFVKYVGSSSDRIIHPHDWKTLTIDPGKGGSNTWNQGNDYLIETSQFSDEQLDYLLIDDMQPSGGHSFLEVDYDDDGNLVQVVE